MRGEVEQLDLAVEHLGRLEAASVPVGELGARQQLRYVPHSHSFRHSAEQQHNLHTSASLLVSPLPPTWAATGTLSPRGPHPPLRGRRS